MNHVFASLHLIYGARFVAQFRGLGEESETLARAKRLWAPHLAELTDDECAVAITRCGRLALNERGEAWPPNLPEFLDLTMPTVAELGIPDENAALMEAQRHAHVKDTHEWSHRVVFYAAQAVGWGELKSRTFREMRPAWLEAYRNLVRRVRMGEALMWLAPTPPPEKPKPASDEVAAEGVAAMRNAIGGD